VHCPGVYSHRRRRCCFNGRVGKRLVSREGKVVLRGRSSIHSFPFLGEFFFFFFPLRKRLFERVSRPLSLAKHDISVGTVLLVCLVHTYSLISRGRERETERERERESDDHPKRPPPSMTGALPTNIHTLRTRVFQSRKTQTWGKSASSVSDCHS
jgi:hypothetical protein